MQSNLNLITHCGAQQVSREKAFAAKAPPATRSFKPIPHGKLYSLVEQELESMGLTIVQDVHALAHEDMRYFGMMEVKSKDASRDYSTVIGLRNSNDKAYPAGLVVGSGVLVCDNLSFLGEIQVARRHTRHILRDLPTLVAGAVAKVSRVEAFQDERISRYREHELVDAEVNNMLIESLDRGIISSAKIGQVLGEWREPRHPEFAEGKTAWRLMNAYTEILKPRKNSPNELFDLPVKTQKLHALLDETVGMEAVFAAA